MRQIIADDDRHSGDGDLARRKRKKRSAELAKRSVRPSGRKTRNEALRLSAKPSRSDSNTATNIAAVPGCAATKPRGPNSSFFSQFRSASYRETEMRFSLLVKDIEVGEYAKNVESAMSSLMLKSATRASLLRTYAAFVVRTSCERRAPLTS
jgi:hypothetical protein